MVHFGCLRRRERRGVYGKAALFKTGLEHTANRTLSVTFRALQRASAFVSTKHASRVGSVGASGKREAHPIDNSERHRSSVRNNCSGSLAGIVILRLKKDVRSNTRYPRRATSGLRHPG